MPMYVFLCKSCGAFEVRMSMKEASAEHPCKQCNQLAKRDYSSVGLVTTDNGLRRRVEAGAQPRVVARSELTGPLLHSHGHASAERPWQIGH